MVISGSSIRFLASVKLLIGSFSVIFPAKKCFLLEARFVRFGDVKFKKSMRCFIKSGANWVVYQEENTLKFSFSMAESKFNLGRKAE